MVHYIQYILEHIIEQVLKIMTCVDLTKHLYRVNIGLYAPTKKLASPKNYDLCLPYQTPLSCQHRPIRTY